MAAASEDNDKNFTKIIIIGAGMAGLSAANHLVKNGMTDFKILEARNKIGGRIESTDTGTSTIGGFLTVIFFFCISLYVISVFRK